MASVNKVILVGNLGRDPEMRYMPSGDAVASFSIATTEKWKDKGGQAQEKTEWHRINMFGKRAEIAGQYLKKGASVYIEGRLQTRKWTDKEGHEQNTTEVHADRMQMLGGRGDFGGDDGQPRQQERTQRRESSPPARPSGSGFDDFEDDIPFDNPYRGRKCYVV